MSKIDQIEEVLNTLKDIDALKSERVALIAENDAKRDANARLTKAENEAEAIERRTRQRTAELEAKTKEMVDAAETKAHEIIDAARITADELMDSARTSAQSMINSTRAQLADEREKLETMKLERGVVESEVHSLELRHEQLTDAIKALKASAQAL